MPKHVHKQIGLVFTHAFSLFKVGFNSFYKPNFDTYI